MKFSFKLWLTDDGGATAIEYSLIAVGIAVAIAAIITLMGVDLLAMYQRLPVMFK